ncbi:N-acetyl-alpha-D-glucosaminyl-diphospho-ditrans, o ctacis-undecaprenol 4-epimerase [Kordiimonadales bacterium JCM 17843]|nr:N-acetyl-alpha-D-glucosaminyl-diphospho-ditrans, o ctacis-undecaprenol 4-epimerase [Kordiimonadales bacterium JCM 17843]
MDEFICSDLVDSSEYEAVLAKVECIHHLAAAKGDWGISEEEYCHDNVEATRALLSAAHAAGVRKWIFYSTVSVLGPSDTPLSEDAPRNPVNPYGASKAVCEDIFEDYVAKTPDAHVVIIRPSVVFGPENPWNTNIFRLVDAIYKRRFLMIGQGSEIKTTSYISNLIDAHMFLMEQRASDHGYGVEIYQYVDDPGMTTMEIVNLIRVRLERGVNKFRLPLSIAAPISLVGDALAAVTGVDLPITSARVRKFCTATNFSGSKIRQLGFKQKISNEQAIISTVDWYLTKYLQRNVK